MRSADTVPGTAHEPSYLVFRAGGERFAIAVDRVRAAAPARGIVPLPGAPPEYAGLTFVRGEPVGVLDAAEALGCMAGPSPGAEGGERGVLLLLEGESRALLVDRVESVEEISQATIGPPPPGNRKLWGMVSSARGFVSLVEVDAVLGSGKQ